MERREKKESGVTLVEIMVSMVIASFVFAGIYGVYTIQQRSYTVQEQVSEMQQKGR
ncbi:prepilin-type N-terminal cleavage/methylation domain-containing protein, partial [Desulfobulbus sp. TB]|nr:prepilin-type N-terminal cleavage/methylation domain-containing protein [Desulfobulbus sp. TB]